MLVSKIDGGIKKAFSLLRERLSGQNVGVYWYQEWLFLCIFLCILLFVIQSALGGTEDTLYDENSAYLRGHVNNVQARSGLSWEKQPLSAASKHDHIKNVLADIDRKAIAAAKKKEKRDMTEKAAKRPAAAADEAKASEDTETKLARSMRQTVTQAVQGVREEDLVNEVLKELPPEAKGERDEWASKQGVHRKEKVL